jgi:hypothetical protein
VSTSGAICSKSWLPADGLPVNSTTLPIQLVDSNQLVGLCNLSPRIRPSGFSGRKSSPKMSSTDRNPQTWRPDGWTRTNSQKSRFIMISISSCKMDTGHRNLKPAVPRAWNNTFGRIFLIGRPLGGGTLEEQIGGWQYPRGYHIKSQVS